MNPLFSIYTKTLDQRSQKNTQMANLMRRSSKYVIGKTKSDIRCKKHPKHQQSPGVCSLCLREKLSKLSTSSSSRIYSSTTMESSSSSSSLSSHDSSSAASSYSSPMHRYRFTTEGKNNISLSTLLFVSKNVLTKSRSLVCAPRMRGKEGDDHHDKKKKVGFLSKLLRPRSKKMEAEGLVHSRTMRDITVTG